MRKGKIRQLKKSGIVKVSILIFLFLCVCFVGMVYYSETHSSVSPSEDLTIS